MNRLNKLNKRLDSYIPISSKEPNSVISEQYRKLRTNIELSSFDKEVKVISLTSTKMMEGKTVTSINLATVYSQSEKKTLLIDMDLRKPKIHRGFHLSHKNGLSNIITENMDLNEAIHQVSPKLHVIKAGNKLPFPAEFLMSDQLKELIKKLRDSYDIIIIDTPPMTAVADAAIISSFVDGTILVIASRETNIDACERVIKELKDNGANIIGSVLTRIRKKDTNYSNYYYYRYAEK